MSWLQQPKKQSLCWVPVPTKDFLWILRDKAIAEFSLSAIIILISWDFGFFALFPPPLRSTWWMPRFSERVKQCMKQVTQVQRALQSMLPCIISIARETARTQHTPPCIKNKNHNKGLSVHSHFKTLPRSWATSYGKRQDSQPSCSKIG